MFAVRELIPINDQTGLTASTAPPAQSDAHESDIGMRKMACAGRTGFDRNQNECR